jgi:hypothetical protein
MKANRVIKRYIELLYHLQTFYDNITDQLYGGNALLRNRLITFFVVRHDLSNEFSLSSQQSMFIHHCRQIAEQLQRSKPAWNRKVLKR